MSDEDSGKFWYCVKDGRVEQGPDLCPPIDRLGPFATYEEASRALAKAAERNEEWEAQDSQDDTSDGGDPSS